MNEPPEPPPEGVLIESARKNAGISVREAARRAGISEGWWRQVVKGYQSLSGGAYGVVRGVPAETVAKMAAAVQADPDELAAEGERPDAAALMRVTAPRRRVLPELEIGPDEEAEVARYRLVVDAERDARFPARNAQESVVWATDLLDEHEKRALVALLRLMEDRSVRQRDENSG
jgi:transcriptional regulator with XRE-family HTH domain